MPSTRGQVVPPGPLVPLSPPAAPSV